MDATMVGRGGSTLFTPTLSEGHIEFMTCPKIPSAKCDGAPDSYISISPCSHPPTHLPTTGGHA